MVFRVIVTTLVRYFRLGVKHKYSTAASSIRIRLGIRNRICELENLARYSLGNAD